MEVLYNGLYSPVLKKHDAYMVRPVATMASLHLCACIPNLLIMEFQLGDIPWRDDLISKPIPIEKGYLKLPEEAGLGIELNKEEVAKRKAD